MQHIYNKNHRFGKSWNKGGETVKRVFGFALFFVGIGIVIGLLAPDGVILALAAAICLLLGYNCFCCG